MCQNNVSFVSHSLKTFENATLKSNYFIPEFSMVALNDNDDIIAFFMVVIKKPYVFQKLRNIATLKFFVVNKKWRLKGIGTYLYNELLTRVKNSNYKRYLMKFDVMVSAPDYWYPGLDPRQTEAFFFLKKQGFKKKHERINLCVNLEHFTSVKPPSELKGYKISRIVDEDKKELIPLSFMPAMYQKSFWPKEVASSFQNEPNSTFIAQDVTNDKILGFATHSVGFPGAFGPTGVNKKMRGLGLGSLLLKWCLWDLKQMGLKQCIIRYVREDTAYFYLKSVGARICEIFWTMERRI
ncbi:MAG: GNAT family N-acetyltransferase [Candidatus Lokiarchaeota archaeon]|nr:GNAT family N-acetyltransferase [Candidatus Lokiarchaeota archaeon]